MRILVSNDDGVYAPGLTVLADALSDIAEITVVAPDRNRSGASNSLTLDNPIKIKHLPNGYISVEGTPTDCVHLAITGLLDNIPDMVVSGINAGSNMGDDILYSGTVAAATEGRFLGLPAIAVSLVGEDFVYYETAARITKMLVNRFKDQVKANPMIVNVNVPDVPYHALQGIEVTRLGTRHLAENVIKDKDPRGNTIYWVGREGPEADAGPGTDFYALRNNKVSVTPLQFDLTQHSAIDTVNSWIADEILVAE